MSFSRPCPHIHNPSRKDKQGVNIRRLDSYEHRALWKQHEEKKIMAGLLQGKVALVTGGGSGIGRASSVAFAREGAKVVVADVVVAGGEETVNLIKQSGGEALFVKTDVAKAAEVEALINTAVATFGRLDCAHNNAGIEGAAATTVNYSEEAWDRVIAINLTGVWLCMKYEIPQMLKTWWRRDCEHCFHCWSRWI